MFLEESPPLLFLPSGPSCPAALQVNPQQGAPPHLSRPLVVVHSPQVAHSPEEGQLLVVVNEGEKNI